MRFFGWLLFFCLVVPNRGAPYNATEIYEAVKDMQWHKITAPPDMMEIVKIAGFMAAQVQAINFQGMGHTFTSNYKDVSVQLAKLQQSTSVDNSDVIANLQKSLQSMVDAANNLDPDLPGSKELLEGMHGSYTGLKETLKQLTSESPTQGVGLIEEHAKSLKTATSQFEGHFQKLVQRNEYVAYAQMAYAVYSLKQSYSLLWNVWNELEQLQLKEPMWIEQREELKEDVKAFKEKVDSVEAWDDKKVAAAASKASDLMDRIKDVISSQNEVRITATQRKEGAAQATFSNLCQLAGSAFFIYLDMTARLPVMKIRWLTSAVLVIALVINGASQWYASETAAKAQHYMDAMNLLTTELKRIVAAFKRKDTGGF